MNMTTIKLKTDTRNKLKQLKNDERESYDKVIHRLMQPKEKELPKMFFYKNTIKRSTVRQTEEIQATIVFITYGDVGISKTTLIKNTNDNISCHEITTLENIFQQMKKGKIVVIDSCMNKIEAEKVAKTIKDYLGIKPVLIEFKEYNR